VIPSLDGQLANSPVVGRLRMGREEARKLLTAAPDVDVAEVRELPPEAREGVYRAALGIVKLDRVVTDDERAFLARLRAALDLDESIIARIEKE